jgi:hypothetical protein
MDHLCGDLSFTKKPLLGLRISSHSRTHHLERNVPAQAHIGGNIHAAHSTMGKQLHNTIAPVNKCA